MNRRTAQVPSELRRCRWFFGMASVVLLWLDLGVAVVPSFAACDRPLVCLAASRCERTSYALAIAMADPHVSIVGAIRTCCASCSKRTPNRPRKLPEPATCSASRCAIVLSTGFPLLLPRKSISNPVAYELLWFCWRFQYRLAAQQIPSGTANRPSITGELGPIYGVQWRCGRLHPVASTRSARLVAAHRSRFPAHHRVGLERRRNRADGAAAVMRSSVLRRRWPAELSALPTQRRPRISGCAVQHRQLCVAHPHDGAQADLSVGEFIWAGGDATSTAITSSKYGCSSAAEPQPYRNYF